jgi:hypothetical protein
LVLLASLTVLSCGGDGDSDEVPSDGGAGGTTEEIECVDLPSTQVIGNWDVVPYQHFDGAFQVGVVAFHELGVDVRFSVDDVPVADVQVPRYNERTSVHEYWVALDAGDYDDGPIVVTATIVPDCPGHLERELDPLTLYADAGATLANPTERWASCADGDDSTGDGTEANPYATIEKAFTEVGAGGTVLLKAGSCYELTSLYPSADYDRWTTVRPAPGLLPADVDILTYGPGDSTGRFGEDMVRWKDVRFHKDVEPGYSTLFYFESDHHAWFDGAELYDANGQWSGGNLVGGNSPYQVYYTDASIHDIMNSGYGFGRNVQMDNIGSDVFRGSSGLMSVNLTVTGIDRGDTEAHPDFFQFYHPDGTVDNVVVYNTKVVDMGAQGIFGSDGAVRNVAFVNLLMEKDPADSALISQLTGDWDHCLLWHVTTVDSGFYIREPAELRNFFIQDGVWASLHADGETSLPGFTIDHNHIAALTWQQDEPMGTNATVGDPKFVDEGSDDYRLQADSPAALAGVPLIGVPADVDGNSYDPQTPTLGAFAQ